MNVDKIHIIDNFPSKISFYPTYRRNIKHFHDILLFINKIYRNSPKKPIPSKARRYFSQNLLKRMGFVMVCQPQTTS